MLSIHDPLSGKSPLAMLGLSDDHLGFYGCWAVLLLMGIWLIYRLCLAALLRRNEELEMKISERTADLRHAVEAAQSSARAKGEFLAKMSHEIRTPMNGILGMTSLLLEMPLGKEAVEAVRVIRTSGEMLMKMLNEILDLSKIESGKLELELSSFELRRCIEETLTLFSYRAAEKNLKLALHIDEDVPAAVRGDASKLRQIMNNLISNAIKFSSSGEVQVLIKVRGASKNPANLHFTVTDHGIGIASEQLNRLFQVYSQADHAADQNYGGTGLGLAICRQLSELMGGRIWVESAPGCGSSFHFVIPMESLLVGNCQAAVPETDFPSIPDTPNAAMPEVNSLRILVAEDNPISQRVAIRLLAKLGYKADLACDGKEALQALIKKPYDVAFMDIQMPRMDGMEVAREIRRRSAPGRRPWIIAMTGNALGGDRETYLAAGMDDYVSKPIDIDILREALRRRPLTAVVA